MRARSSALIVLGAVAGAGLAWLLDPVSGRRRRHMARDRTAATARRGLRRSRRLVRHVSSDFLGLARRLVRRLPHEAPELDDITLAHKVETLLFRDPAVPKGRINVNAEHGVVYLRGEVEAQDLVAALEERARKVAGVRDVRNLLHLPGAPALIPRNSSHE